MRQIFHDSHQNHNIVETGYTHLSLLSASEINYLLTELKKTCPEASFNPDGLEPSHKFIYSSYLLNDLNLRKVGNRIVREVFTSHVEKIFDRYRILSCGFFIKAPRGGELGLHSHWLVTESLRDTVVNIWCPLVETSVENGTFHAVPGSHKIFPEVICFGYRPFYLEYTNLIKEKYSIALPSHPGQAVIFDDTMMHWSPDNFSDKPRYAVHCTCIPVEARSTYVYFDKSFPDRFDVYAVNDDFFVENGLTQDLPRPKGLPLLGTIPNSNHAYTQNEFEEMMTNGAAIRRELQTEAGQANLPGLVSVPSVNLVAAHIVSEPSQSEEKQENKQDVGICASVMNQMNASVDASVVNFQTEPLNTVQSDSQPESSLESLLDAGRQAKNQQMETKTETERKFGLLDWLGRLRR